MNERKEHLDQVERWALFVREHPTEWKKTHTEFINALFDKHEQFKERLLKTPRGREKLEKLYPLPRKGFISKDINIHPK